MDPLVDNLNFNRIKRSHNFEGKIAFVCEQSRTLNKIPPHMAHYIENEMNDKNKENK